MAKEVMFTSLGIGALTAIASTVIILGDYPSDDRVAEMTRFPQVVVIHSGRDGAPARAISLDISPRI